MLWPTVFLWISAVACVSWADHHVGQDMAKVEPSQNTKQDNSVSVVNTANKEFAFRLYSALASQPDSQDKNVFFSPISVSIALAALSVGARGETHEQLFTGLGFNSSLLSQAQVNQAFRALLNKNVSQDATQGTAVFVDGKSKPNPEFLDTLRKFYATDGFTMDFTKSTESADTINKYVSDKTNRKIDKMVENLDPATVMYLLSYIYFKGKWETPFDPQSTQEEMFEVSKNTKVPVQMMNMQETYDFLKDKEVNASVLHLPFNSSYSMLLMLPDNMAALEKVLCPCQINKILKNMEPRTYKVFVPKFSIKTSYQLRDVLSGMGMLNMFSASADLTGISDGLTVSSVVHKATLDVDEEGATASAATGIEFVRTAFIEPPVLKFNRPFMAFIIDRNTEDILFMGKITNPNI